MTGYGPDPDDAAADLRRLAFDQSRQDGRSDPGKDDGRIVGFDGVNGDPDGVLRVEDLVAALLRRRQPALDRSQVDDEIVSLAASDDGGFQLSDAITVAFGAGEHPGGSQPGFEHGAGRPRRAAGGGPEGNGDFDQVAGCRARRRGGDGHLRLGILNLRGHPLSGVADQASLAGVEAGAQGTAAALRRGKARRLFNAGNDLGPIDLRGEFLDGGHQIDGRLRPPGRFPSRAA